MTRSKILIVDDEPFNVDYLEQELEDLDYEILTAANGQEALDQVKAGSPDLILLDIMMPVMDGFTVLSHLKENPATREIPVIVISASNNLQSVVKGIQLGAEDYLPKPFEPTLLQARISSSLEKKHLRDLQQLYLKSLERELEIGREIQQGFLPSELPEVSGWEIGAYFKAAHEVAGDYYDAFLLPDGNLVCVIGDVCGKGVGAALFMSLFRSLIRATSTTDLMFQQPHYPPLTALARLQHAISFTNHYVTETHGDKCLFTTVFICMMSPSDNKLTYINSGNEPPLLIRNGNVIAELNPTGPVVGVLPEAEFSAGEIQMETHDLLLAFTDGVTDALNYAEEAFGKERLLNLLDRNDSTPGKLLDKIEQQLKAYIGKVKQFDDITLMAIKKI